ncbi:MAG: hypothetical protein GQ535_07890 [Rhodobacteraceae bacterium]|nr:hypothetical protein [Paracoccaceae bacterium]
MTDERQKACKYCGTPADPLAVTCENCGSALPIALPKSIPEPVARLVEAQSRWGMGKTAGVSIFVSLLLGVFLNAGMSYTALVGSLTGLWLLLVLPVMLFTSAIMNARKDAGRAVVNLIAATSLWILAVILVTMMALIY